MTDNSRKTENIRQYDKVDSSSRIDFTLRDFCDKWLYANRPENKSPYNSVIRKEGVRNSGSTKYIGEGVELVFTEVERIPENIVLKKYFEYKDESNVKRFEDISIRVNAYVVNAKLSNTADIYKKDDWRFTGLIYPHTSITKIDDGEQIRVNNEAKLRYLIFNKNDTHITYNLILGNNTIIAGDFINTTYRNIPTKRELIDKDPMKVLLDYDRFLRDAFLNYDKFLADADTHKATFSIRG